MIDLMQEFQDGAAGIADTDMVGTLWAIVADIQSSYKVAMESAGVPSETVAEVTTTVDDYLANHYGDDEARAYIAEQECMNSGQHLKSTDDDGFCNSCGSDARESD